MHAPLALVFASMCSGKFIGTIREVHPDLPAFTIGPVKPLRTLAGTKVRDIQQIPAKAVFWIGVPPRWVEQFGELPYQSHFAGHPEVFRAHGDVADTLNRIQGLLTPSAPPDLGPMPGPLGPPAPPHLPQFLGEEPPWFIPEPLL